MRIVSDVEEGEGARESASEEPKDHHHQNWIQVKKEVGDERTTVNEVVHIK